MIAIICPGQGTQTRGMLSPWLDQPGIGDRVAEWSDRANVDLVRLGTTASAQEIAQTQNAQPLIVATSLLAATALSSSMPAAALGDAASILDTRLETTSNANVVVAGHSLGAITAAAIAGVFEFADAVAIAAKRGEFMAEIVAKDHRSGGMASVIGAPFEEVHEAATKAGLQIATVNAPNQITIAGPTDRLDAFEPPRRARVVRLMVSGPFHTAAYHGAADKFTNVLAAYPTDTPKIPIISDLDGTITNDVPGYLVKQISSPVRWDKVTKHLAQARGIIELPPAGTFSRLARRALQAEVITVNTPTELEAGAQLLGLGI